MDRGTQYLLEKGWKLVATRPNGYGLTQYWDHPNHQPDRRGLFTKTAAEDHQKKVDKYGRSNCLVYEA